MAVRGWGEAAPQEDGSLYRESIVGGGHSSRDIPLLFVMIVREVQGENRRSGSAVQG